MNIALLLSGGTGLRLGADILKQYIEVGGKPIISYCIEKFSCHDKVDAIQVVADAGWQPQIKEWLDRYDVNKKFKGFSEPGMNRQLSIYHGLAYPPDFFQNRLTVWTVTVAAGVVMYSHMTAVFAPAEIHAEPA